MVSRRTFMFGSLAAAVAPGALAAESDPWALLRKGDLVILMRHATTEPGIGGDPPGYKLDDCSTQRNLSHAGRAESQRVGERFRAERIPIARVYTSPWCRCRETAMLAFGRAEDWEPLSSFFDFPDREPAYTETVKKRIGGYGRRNPGGNVVMVTHNDNIAALSRHSVAQAEMVLMRADGCCNTKPLDRLKVP
jgi:broad specificity phosphatase PhoE